MIYNVLLVDDHYIIRRGLQAILEDNKIIGNIEHAENGIEAIEKLNKGTYHIIFLDVRMPLMNGFECLKQIRKLNKDVIILVVSNIGDRHQVSQMMAHGANGYLLKDVTPEEINIAIKKIIHGDKYFSSGVAIHFLQEHQNGGGTIASGKDGMLNDREIAIIRLMCRGLKSTDIGNALHLSVSTIRKCRQSIKKKTNTNSQAELVTYALRYELISQGDLN